MYYHWNYGSVLNKLSPYLPYGVVDYNLLKFKSQFKNVLYLDFNIKITSCTTLSTVDIQARVSKLCRLVNIGKIIIKWKLI